jgi:hypothetical protein
MDLLNGELLGNLETLSDLKPEVELGKGIHTHCTGSDPSCDMSVSAKGRSDPPWIEELVPVTESYCGGFLAHRPSICLRNSARAFEFILFVMASLILLAVVGDTFSSRMSGVRQARYSLLWHAGSAKFPG